ncbi:helicase-related protein [uncultured Clostridium sp.]|jgi:hypothetical protein|uniref:helicase-related protein n=1 Tax=uncultured Clostridium sp. TaxID=59620 RepID=UPI00262788B7|nr:helicase-related protein [uncultured Clostridium sp.]
MNEKIRIRKEIVDRCRAEMLGPGSEDIGGEIEREVISDSPKERYSIGILFPQENYFEEIEKQDFDEEELKSEEEIVVKQKGQDLPKSEIYQEALSGESDGIQEQMNMTNQFLPAAMGFTFFTKGSVESIKIRVSCARYRESSFRDCCVKVSNINDEEIKAYLLADYVYVEDGLLKLKQNITPKILFEKVNGSVVAKKRPDIVSVLYKLSELCTVDQYRRGYVRVPFLNDKIIDISLKEENNKIFINENGEVIDEGIIKINVLAKKYDDNVSSYTIVMVNEQKGNPNYKKCLYQPEIRVRTDENNFDLIEHTYMSKKGNIRADEEEKIYELLYRNKKSYSIGHGVGTNQEVDNDGKGEIYTDFLPCYEVPQLEFVIKDLENSDEILSMFELSDFSTKSKIEKIELLSEFCESYERWITGLKENSNTIDVDYEEIIGIQIEKCVNTLVRMRRGIEILKEDDRVYTAFSLMNRAMLMQRYHSKFSEGEHDRFPEDKEFPKFDYENHEAKKASWRAFQLAFVLMNIESIDNPDSKDRDIVDLIWIPTGGGKTEAYLGLTGLTIFLRRLKDPIYGGGTAIIMRYTLRLLAAQQFVRASILICACEKIRRESKEYNLGEEEITIGLWVGGTPTPNKNKEATEKYKKLIKPVSSAYELEYNKRNYNKFQILKCPWCGTKLEIEYVDGKKKGRWGYNYDKKKNIFCPDFRCDFKAKLPIQVVDEELYKNPPTLLFGTVDKFASLPWTGEVSKLFGLDDQKLSKQPELIIQDELHLISGPLGSMVGLYETAIDAICSNIGKNKGLKPKIVASTATIKRAKEQCKMLFNREVSQFPPSGIKIEDSFFTKEVPVSEKPGRLYVGMMPSGKTPTTTQVRLYTAILESPSFIEAEEDDMDKYWTLVGYFNSIRELGKTSNLVKDDIASNISRYMKRLLKSDKVRYANFPHELTSRVESTEIIKILSNLENNYKEVADSNFNNRPIDVLLASNMISVGVDVSRLDLMVVSGQPKQTAEYIQATSRVGRRYPGLVFTLYNQSKTRDRSHYELFYPYHQTFYKYVEPTSITPFSEQARERGLHAVVISMIRHLLNLKNDEDANDFTKDIEGINLIKDYIIKRARDLDSTELQDVARETELEIDNIIKKWDNKVKTAVDGDKVCYRSDKFNKNLLMPYLKENENNAFPTMQSLRNVDSEAKVEILVFGGADDE